MPSTSSTAKRATGPVVLSDRGLAGLAAFGAALERVRRNLHEQLGPDEELTKPPNGRPGPATRRGIHVGSTVAELCAAYGRQVQIFPIEAPDIGFRVGPRRAGHRRAAQRRHRQWPGHPAPRRPGLRRMTGDGRVRGGAAVVRWRLAATTALAMVALAGGCTLEHGQPTSGGPSTVSGPPATGGRPAQYTYYAQAASFSGPDAWQHAQRQAQQLRAKGLPATVYESHTEFPSHTLYFFVAVASGEYSTRDQAHAQVARLRRAGFADAKVVEISLPK